MIRRNPNKFGKTRVRRGSAVIELALILPVVVLIVFGSIEATNAIYLQQIVTEVAYQGALEGVNVSSTEQMVIDRMQNYVDQTSFSGVTFQVISTDGVTDFDDLIVGETFRVSVTAPFESMSLGLQAFSGLNDVTGIRVGSRQ